MTKTIRFDNIDVFYGRMAVEMKCKCVGMKTGWVGMEREDVGAEWGLVETK